MDASARIVKLDGLVNDIGQKSAILAGNHDQRRTIGKMINLFAAHNVPSEYVRAVGGFGWPVDTLTAKTIEQPPIAVNLHLTRQDGRTRQYRLRHALLGNVPNVDIPGTDANRQSSIVVVDCDMCDQLVLPCRLA